MTDPDFFADMAVGIPPITPPAGPAPNWIGIDLANGPDMHAEVGIAADGAFYAITEEQNPMTKLKAFYVDDMPTIYAAESIEHAAELYETDCGEAPADGYPYQASEQDLDMPVPETDEDEQPTGVMTTMRAWLEAASPGFLCGAE
ncbi:hypothetical protein [Stenotrophomonas sepilia]|uniref:hypothetical protein n=1 Tax=Stenotrophomonas sepilia TaxID=2860290 RepID=UPI003EE72A96